MPASPKPDAKLDEAPAAPAVSVVVPVKDRAELIGDTLQSVANQTFGDFECIVVDDGSTDDTPQVVSRFIERDPRFRMIRIDAGSASGARNAGVAEARGKYLAFLDSDDLFEPDKLEWQVEALQQDAQAVLAYGDTFHFREGDPHNGHLYLQEVRDKPAGHAFERLLCCSAIYAPLVRTEAFRAAGGFDESLPSAEDWDMWLKLARRGRLVHRPRIALRYRVHAGNKSGLILRNLACAREVVRRHTSDLPTFKRWRLRWGAWKTFARNYVPALMDAVADAERRDDARAALAHLKAAVRLRPWLLRRPRVLRRLWHLRRLVSRVGPSMQSDGSAQRDAQLSARRSSPS